jgi:hypothetical protein
LKFSTINMSSGFSRSSCNLSHFYLILNLDDEEEVKKKYYEGGVDEY